MMLNTLLDIGEPFGLLLLLLAVYLSTLAPVVTASRPDEDAKERAER